MQTQKELKINEAGEKLIAQFMGESATGGYFQSWDCLMPVIDKIEDLDNSKQHYQWEDLDGSNRSNFAGYEVDINYYDCRIWLNLELDPPQLITHTKCDSRIEAVYNAVINFITWYNERRG
jgi:hypothetical protein